MTSIGNDIIALNDIDMQRTCHARFYSRILSADEQQMHSQYMNHITFGAYIWLLWSVKESAYKYLKRSDPALVFSPVSIMVRELTFPHTKLPGFKADNLHTTGFDDRKACRAVIGFKDHTLYSNSLIYQNLIHTVVSGTTCMENINWGISSVNDPFYETQAAGVRKSAMARLHTYYPDEELRIVKNLSGCPVVYNAAGSKDVSLTMSHHGRYVSYAFIKGGDGE